MPGKEEGGAGDVNRTEFILFDLDNTLYPRACGLFDEVDRRINLYLERYVGIPPDAVDSLRRRYFSTHGTTLNGLMLHHRVAPEHYLDFVHDIRLDAYLTPDPGLRALLAALPGKKFIFSNASRKHCRRVLETLGLEGIFAAVFALEDFSYRPKPRPEIYRELLERIGCAAGRGAMVDDLAVNLEPAAALGMRTFLYVPAASAEPGEPVSPSFSRACNTCRPITALSALAEYLH